MNKKQVIAVSVVAAVPAMGLLIFLVLGLLQGMLSDGATVSVTLWIVWVLAALSSIVVSFLPFAIMFFPGLMPEPATAGVGDAPPAPARKQPRDEEDADESGESFDEDYEEASSEDDEGEQLFDDGAVEDEYDDFGDSFDDDKK